MFDAVGGWLLSSIIVEFSSKNKPASLRFFDTTLSQGCNAWRLLSVVRTTQMAPCPTQLTGRKAGMGAKSEMVLGKNGPQKKSWAPSSKH